MVAVLLLGLAMYAVPSISVVMLSLGFSANVASIVVLAVIVNVYFPLLTDEVTFVLPFVNFAN